MQRIASRKITINSGRIVFAALLEQSATGQTPAVDNVDAIIAEKSLAITADAGELTPIIDAVLAANAKIVADFKSGKQQAIGALIGQVMKQTKGADPQVVRELLQQRLAALERTNPPPKRLGQASGVSPTVPQFGRARASPRVIPGSHRHGWLDNEISRWKERVEPVTCLARSGISGESVIAAARLNSKKRSTRQLAQGARRCHTRTGRIQREPARRASGVSPMVLCSVIRRAFARQLIDENQKKQIRTGRLTPAARLGRGAW